MPIRLNLLAEAQAAEELRRRDPVKRVIFGGVLVVALIFAWWSWLQLRVMVAKSNLSQVEAQIQSHTNAYQVVLVDEKKIAETKGNLAALQKLTNNRFLQGNLLNALQYATVPGVQLVKLRVDQTYQADQTTAAHTNVTVTEKIVLSLDAEDFSTNPGDQVNKFKDAISDGPYFEAKLGGANVVRLINLSAPQVDSSGKSSVLFTLQCAYPDQTR
ncbi:MAG: PilN domain-containing protein [Limisphaerales bacterium]